VSTLLSLHRVQFTSCGTRADAADFALCLTVGRLDAAVARSVPFTLFSGDRGFDEVLSHLGDRPVMRLDPHHVRSDDGTLAMLRSVVER
jgi:hypothetical protein